MVMTVLEAHVPSDRWSALEEAYQAGIANLDPGITQTFLVHSASDPTVWRIITIWESREALNTMRNSGETPRGVLMFRAAGAEPALSVFEVAAHAAAPVTAH